MEEALFTSVIFRPTRVTSELLFKSQFAVRLVRVSVLKRLSVHYAKQQVWKDACEIIYLAKWHSNQIYLETKMVREKNCCIR